MGFVPNTLIDQFGRLSRQGSDMMTLWANAVSVNIDQFNRTSQSIFELYQKQISLLFNTPPGLINSALEYEIDTLQRSIIFLDVIRKRGNQYLEHVAAGQPPVLIFKYIIIMDGRTFEKPVNYALVEIQPPNDIEIDKKKRPYLIIDPRAGHGSGIGGFKDDSQVGIALRAGHPVYFVIFFPEPEPGQTLHDITLAEEKFLREVARRHPNSLKPCLIGNCQGGWAAMALVAAHPDVASVVVINGAPLAYWAGVNGKNPMRYVGGILGGSWLAQLAGDLGHGKFDGAHLISNFELLNPSDTFWKKYYDLFANLNENEEKRFLDFERWWGGFSLLNTKEMRTIVDNLFIGNKLAHGKIPLDRNSNIDLRNITLPIIIFCSDKDNITPPQQALNWISDIYSDVLEIKLAGQVIVYLRHQNAGHLGIFVSGSIAKKEYRQIVDLLNYVEHLPPGLYEMSIHEERNVKNAMPHYSISLEERTIDDILSLSNITYKEDEELFNIVRVISDFNSTAYDFLFSPVIRAFTNERLAEFFREIHPMRMSRYVVSDLNILLWYLSIVAPMARNNRVRASESNPFVGIQLAWAEVVSASMESSRELRDSATELLFYWLYGSTRALLPSDLPFRDALIETLQKEDKELDQHVMATIEEGGVPDAVIRILLLLINAERFTKGSHISTGVNLLRSNEAMNHLTDSEFRSIVRTQTVIVEYDSELAISTLTQLVKSNEERKQVLSIVNHILTAADVILPQKAQNIIEKITKTLAQKNSGLAKQ